MKKIHYSLLALIFILSLTLTVGAVSVNQVFSYLDSGWGNGSNPEAKGLWKYEWLARETGVIGDMRWAADGYFEAPFTTAAASDTHWWCRVGNDGMLMHPGAQADSIKTFICPAEGKVDFKVVCNRQYGVQGSNNGNSVRVFLNGEKVWPTDKEHYELSDTSALTVKLQLDVKKGDLIRFLIGSLGNSGGDGVTLQEHSVTYLSGPELTPEVKLNNYTIACVGDSITEGYMTSGGLKGNTAYPAQLQKLLNNIETANYTVKNFGKSTRTALKNGDYPYINTTEYSDSMASNPDIVIICFGANDSKPNNWNAASFKKDYKELIKGYQDLPSKPTVYLFYTTYVADQSLTSISRDVIQNQILDVEGEIASELGCKIIDLNTLTRNNADKYADGVHPNDELQKMMAQYIFDALCSENAIELKSSDAKNSVSMIDPSKQEETTPEVTTKPETTKPQTTTKVETTKPETTKPDTTASDTTNPDTTATDTSDENTTLHDTMAPDTTNPDTGNGGKGGNKTPTVAVILCVILVPLAVVIVVITSKKNK